MSNDPAAGNQLEKSHEPTAVAAPTSTQPQQRGWGTTNQHNRDCCNCVNRKAGCYTWLYWYAPYDADDSFVMGEFTRNCCGWETKSVNVDGATVGYKYERPCCPWSDSVVEVYGENRAPIGSVVVYERCCAGVSECEDYVWLEAFTQDKKSEFTLWQPGCITRCKRNCQCKCTNGCECTCGRCVSCCGYIEQDYIVSGPREAGVDSWRATLTYRYHTCHQWYPRWFGYRVWPENSGPTEKALMLGVLHTLNPFIR